MHEKGDCQESRYALNEESPHNDTIFVLNSQFRDEKTGFDLYAGVVKCKGAHCTLKFKWYIPECDYRVLDTDYKEYAIVYSCMNILGIARREYVWILTRDIEPKKELFDHTLKVLRERIPWYDLNNLYETKQGGNCRYLPLSELESKYDNMMKIEGGLFEKE